MTATAAAPDRSRRARGLAPALWAAAALIACTGPATPAAAAMRLCSLHSLTVRDYVGARDAAVRAVRGIGPLASKLPEVCRNPTNASAGFETTPRVTPDGVREWWTLRCNRGTGEWSCEAPYRQRTFPLAVPLAGSTVQTVVQLAQASDLDLARVLIPLALRAVSLDPSIAEEPSTRGGCRVLPVDASATAEASAWAATLASGPPLQVSVWDENGIELDFKNAMVLVEFKPQGAPPEQQQACLSDVVVVT